jgi:hypothetical protein
MLGEMNHHCVLNPCRNCHVIKTKHLPLIIFSIHCCTFTHAVDLQVSEVFTEDTIECTHWQQC